MEQVPLPVLVDGSQQSDDEEEEEGAGGDSSGSKSCSNACSWIRWCKRCRVQLGRMPLMAGNCCHNFVLQMAWMWMAGRAAAAPAPPAPRSSARVGECCGGGCTLMFVLPCIVGQHGSLRSILCQLHSRPLCTMVVRLQSLPPTSLFRSAPRLLGAGCGGQAARPQEPRSLGELLLSLPLSTAAAWCARLRHCLDLLLLAVTESTAAELHTLRTHLIPVCNLLRLLACSFRFPSGFLCVQEKEVLASIEEMRAELSRLAPNLKASNLVCLLS